MHDLLTSLLTDVTFDVITFEFFHLSDASGSHHHFTRNFCIGIFQRHHRINVLPGHDQNMRFCFRMDIIERHTKIIFIHDGGGDFLVDNPTEKAVHRGGKIPLKDTRLPPNFLEKSPTVR